MLIYLAQLVKNLPTVQGTVCSAGDIRDAGSISGLGRSPGRGNGNPLQYSGLGNPVDRGAWQAIVHGVVRVRHDLATKPPLPPQLLLGGGNVEMLLMLFCIGCVNVSCSVMSDSSWPHGLEPARLLCPWDFLGKNIGVGCHFLLHYIG